MTSSQTTDITALNQIQGLLGSAGWKSEADAQRYYEDPRGSYIGNPGFVVMPENTEQVSQIVRICQTNRIGIIPYGGGTGVVAGQLSLENDTRIILSLERMNRIRNISTEDFVLTAEAGCILENIHAAAEEHGMVFPLSMGSKGSCTIGGNLATNAGGIQVLRHGNARDLCLGIEAVLSSGDILHALTPLRKNNTGYDLRHLLIGSEGTLGIITAASLVIKPLDAETATAFCALTNPADAMKVFQSLRASIGDRLSGLELMSGFGVNLVTTHFSNLPNPFEQNYDWFLLVEAGGNFGTHAELETALADLFEASLIKDAIIAASEAQRTALWALRERTPEANRLTGAFCSSDTSVPIGNIDQFITLTQQKIAAIHPDLRINTYGHIGDGNIHHNIFPPAEIPKPEFLKTHPGIAQEVREAINQATLHFGGSISAEHGIGRLKRHDLERHTDKTKLTTLRAIKQALDPNNIMNPAAMIARQ